MTLVIALPLAFAAGVLTILSPCVLPLVPIVMLTMFVYALGTAGALVAVAFGLPRLTSRSAAAAAGARGRFALGATVAVFGALVVTGLDHRVEAALVAAMPDWLATAAASL